MKRSIITPSQCMEREDLINRHTFHPINAFHFTIKRLSIKPFRVFIYSWQKKGSRILSLHLRLLTTQRYISTVQNAFLTILCPRTIQNSNINSFRAETQIGSLLWNHLQEHRYCYIISCLASYLSSIFTLFYREHSRRMKLSI